MAIYRDRPSSMPLTGSKTKRLYLPAITIIASVLTLLVLLSLHTIRNFRHERARMEEYLHREGQVILRSLEAGARSGMMRMMDRGELIQALIEEIASRMDLSFAMLMDRTGRILAHSQRELIGKKADDIERYHALFEVDEAKSWFTKDDIFIVAKRFEPLGASRHSMANYEIFMHSMMGGRRGGPSAALPYGRPVLVVAGLKTTEFREAMRSDLNHAILMGLILFSLGSAAFYFIFVVQNYYLIRRTLDSMTTYATQIVDHMPNGLVSLNAQGEVVTLNNKARKLFGLETVNKDEQDRLKDQFLKPCASLIERIGKGETVIEEEVLCRQSDGDAIPISVSGARLKSEDGTDLGSVLILRDLREIKELQDRVRRSERLAALGGLAAGVAHEIRNPLGSIRGFAQYFLKKYPPGSVDNRYSEVMIKEVDRLNRVIANLLDFARPKEPVLDRVHLNEVVLHGLELVREDAESRQIEVQTALMDNIPPAMIDRDQITQAFLNVLINAVEATEAGGKIRIETSFDTERRAHRIVVQDTGCGIDPKDIGRIFDPFFTKKKRGTGLGLAIAHRIMENHGGHIRAESKGTDGTRFIMEFPPNEGRIQEDDEAQLYPHS